VERTSEDANPDPPAVPVYENEIVESRVFRANETLLLTWMGEKNGVFRFTPEQRRQINNNDAWLWLYGYIVFTNAIDDEFTKGFIFHWEAREKATIGTTQVLTPRGFVMEGPAPYLYQREKKSKYAT
jgi:hypothetical protein